MIVYTIRRLTIIELKFNILFLAGFWRVGIVYLIEQTTIYKKRFSPSTKVWGYKCLLFMPPKPPLLS